MIQRIQSIFLLLAALAAFALFELPFGSSDKEVAASMFFSDKTFDITDNLALLILFALSGVIALVSIFLFKNRNLQLTLGRLAIITNILGIILGVVLFMQDSPNLNNTVPNEEMGLLLPILFLLFMFLAARFIRKDEKLVRSMDRLR